MNFSFRRESDQISPDIVRRLRAAQDRRPALQAAGLVIEALAKRAFNEPGLRPSPWAPRKNQATRNAKGRFLSQAILKRSGTLFRSPRIASLSNDEVSVGTDRPYARYHQLGQGRMYRPFFPFTRAGRLTPLGRERIEAALKRKLGLPK